jgi:NAD(P)-dependent dehydrogenase (short-subunit alcohol dehydrogenase family)
MNQKKIALVTGANRGIGFEICRQLAANNFHVILTARDKTKGQEALNILQQEDIQVDFYPLQVTSSASRNDLKRYVVDKFITLDVLINNAGILIKNSGGALDVSIEDMKETFETNLLGPLALAQQFIPLMKINKYGRIVNISSTMGSLSQMGSGYAAYRISKTGLNAATRILANETMGHNILINSLCPGWVKTDMGGAGADRSATEGAASAIWLANLPDGGPSGKFFRDKKEIPW